MTSDEASIHRLPRYRMTIGRMMVAILVIGIVLGALIRLPGAVPIAVVLGYIFGPIILLMLMRGNRGSFPRFGKLSCAILAFPEIILELLAISALIKQIRFEAASPFSRAFGFELVWNIAILAGASVGFGIILSIPGLVRLYILYIACILRESIEASPARCPCCRRGRLKREFRFDRMTRRWVDSEYSHCPRCGNRGRYSNKDSGPTWEPIDPEIEMIMQEAQSSESQEM
jgi:hypothetical protein